MVVEIKFEEFSQFDVFKKCFLNMMNASLINLFGF